MTNAYTGFFLRDFMGQKPNGGGSDWTYSPDVISYASTQFEPNWFGYLFDTSGPSGYKRNFNLPPIYTWGNFVYVRGLYYNEGKPVTEVPSRAEKTRIYLFHCEPDKFHLTANWKSDGIVGYEEGVWAPSNPKVPYAEATLKNYIAGNGKAAGVGALGMFQWTPAELAEGAKPLYLIAYAAAPGDDFKPSDLGADLGTGDALKAFVESHPNLAVLNTSPDQGVFARDFIGQTSYQSSSNNLSSPDIGMSGFKPLSEKTLNNYEAALGNEGVHAQVWNRVYLRVRAKAAVSEAKIRLYYTPSTFPGMGVPQTWQQGGFAVGEKLTNEVKVSAAAAGDVVIVPFLWNPPGGATKYTLFAYTQNELLSKEPNIAMLGGDLSTVGESVGGYLQISALTDITTSSDPVPDIHGGVVLPTVSADTQVWVGLKFVNMTSGGTFEFSLDGLGSSQTLTFHGKSIDDANQMILAPTQYGAGDSPLMLYRYFKGTTIPGGAHIVPVAFSIDATGGGLTPMTLTDVGSVRKGLVGACYRAP